MTNEKIAEELRAQTAVIPDFPKKGVNFIDVTTVLRKPQIYQRAVAALAEHFDPDDYDVIVSPEARGFLLGAPVALAQSKPFIPIRDPEKLPREAIGTESNSEYDDRPLAIHTSDITRGARVLIVDDVLATGGTALAMIDLVRRIGHKPIGISALYNLPYLPKRRKLPIPLRAVLTYEEAPGRHIVLG